MDQHQLNERKRKQYQEELRKWREVTDTQATRAEDESAQVEDAYLNPFDEDKGVVAHMDEVANVQEDKAEEDPVNEGEEDLRWSLEARVDESVRYSFLQCDSIYFWALYSDELEPSSVTYVHFSTLLLEGVVALVLSTAFGTFWDIRSLTNSSSARTDDYPDLEFFVEGGFILGAYIIVAYLGCSIIPLCRECARIYESRPAALEHCNIRRDKVVAHCEAPEKYKKSLFVRARLSAATYGTVNKSIYLAYLWMCIYTGSTYAIAYYFTQWATERHWAIFRVQLLAHSATHVLPYALSFAPGLDVQRVRWLRCLSIVTPFTHLLCDLTRAMFFYSSNQSVNQVLNLVFFLVTLGDLDNRVLNILWTFDLIKMKQHEELPFNPNPNPNPLTDLVSVRT